MSTRTVVGGVVLMALALAVVLMTRSDGGAGPVGAQSADARADGGALPGSPQATRANLGAQDAGPATPAAPPAVEATPKPDAAVAEMRALAGLWMEMKSYDLAARRIQGAAEYESKMLELTSSYLGLDAGRQGAFAKVVDEALARLDKAQRLAGKAQAAYDPEDPATLDAQRAAWETFTEQQRAAAEPVLSFLGASLREKAFAADALKWLLHLRSGMEQSGRPATQLR